MCTLSITSLYEETEMNPEDEILQPWWSWLWEGRLQLADGNPRKAREAFEEALRIGLPPPKEVECRLALAETFFVLSRGGEHVERHHEDVANQFEAALRLDQQEKLGIVAPEHLVSGAAVLTDLRWVREAGQWRTDWPRRIEYLTAKRQLVAHVPGPHMLRTTFCIAEAHQQLGNEEEAIREYKSVMECEVSPYVPGDSTPDALKYQAEYRLQSLEEKRLSGAGRNSRQSDGCWIATAVTGSQSAEVTILQAYRDTQLVRSRVGRLVIAIYSMTSPPIAHAASRSPRLRRLLRAVVVQPAVRWAARRIGSVQ